MALKGRLKQQKKVSTTMLLIIGSFLLFWLPSALDTADDAFNWDETFRQKILKKFVDEHVADDVAILFTYSLFYLTLMNSFLDPLIFVLRTKKIRVEIKNFVLRRSPQLTGESSTRNFSMSSIKSVSSSVEI